MTVAVPGKEAIVRQVPMMTPGDVIGIPARQVIRCAPLNGVVDAEPNYLATIDFDAPDLPWLFSRKPASGPIQPWITLAVIDVTDLDDRPAVRVAGRHTADDCRRAAAESCRSLDVGARPAARHRHGAGRPCAIALASRQFQEAGSRTAATWRASCPCSPPARPRASASIRATRARAWISRGIRPPADVTLPVYYFWRFATGPNGDFESLVRALHGVPLPPGLGKRRLLLDYPMSGLPAPDPKGASLELQVALRPPGATLDDIQPLVGASYLDILRSRLVDAGYDTSLLTAHPDAPPPAVGPPVYGQLAVGETATAATLQTVAPPWVRATNLDPRLRVAAGLGGEVVRQNQDRYVEEAWRQVGDVLGANGLRRRAEFSLAASATLHRKWISRIPAADLVTSTAPVHARVFVGENLTITGRLRQSPLPPSIASVEYRRVTRARGSLAGAAAWRASVGPAVLASRSADAQPLKAAVAIDTIDVLDAPSKVWGVAAAPSILARLDPGLNQTGMTAAQVATQLDSMNQLPTVAFATAAQAAAHVGAIDADARAHRGRACGRSGTCSQDVIATTHPGVTVTTPPGGPVTTHPGGPIDDATAAGCRRTGPADRALPDAGADGHRVEAADDRRRQGHHRSTDRRVGRGVAAGDQPGRRLRIASADDRRRARSGGDDGAHGQPSHHRR